MIFFNEKAKEYDGWYKSKMGKFVDDVETELAFKMFTPVKGMRVLDVGCGTGNFSVKLARMGCEVVGLDISQDMLDIARKKAQDKNMDIQFLLGDVYDLKFDDSEFDAVFSMAAFEFIKEAPKAYKEMMRVLKPQGQLLIGTIHRNSSWGQLYMSKAFQEDSVFRHADFKSLEDLIALDEKSLVTSGECLFLPPDTPEEEINMDRERELSKTERGGFVCVLWKKGS